MLVPPEEFVPLDSRPLARLRTLLLESTPLRFTLLILSYLVLVGLAVCYPTVVRRWNTLHPTSQLDTPGYAAINGHNISRLEFFTALNAVRGPQVLNHIMECKAILQEAEQRKVTLSSTETALEMDRINESYKSLAVRSYFEEDMRARLLLRKLLLENVTQAQKQHVYQTFKAGLAQYELFAIMVNTPADARAVEAALQRHDRFSEVAARYSKDARSRQAGGRYGFVTLPTLATAFNPFVAASVGHLQPGRYVRLVTEEQIVFLEVGTIRDSYTDLESSIEDVLAETGRVQLLYRLMGEARISFYDPGADSSPVPSAKPLPGNRPVQDGASPLPGNKPVDVLVPPLPGAKPVHEVPPNLPGNKPVQNLASPLPGNKAVPDLASPVPGATAAATSSPPP